MRNITKLAVGAAMVLGAATAAMAPASAQAYGNYSHSFAYRDTYGAPLYAPHRDRNYQGHYGLARQGHQEFQRYAERHQRFYRDHTSKYRYGGERQYGYRQRG